MTVLFTSRVPGFVGADFNDPTNERLIWLSAAGLVLVGAALLVGTILWWRRGKQEHPSLAPLEVLGSRSWTRATETDRRRKLDRVRIGGAADLEDGPLRSEPVDLRELVRNVPAAFDDLRDPGPDADVAPAAPDPNVAPAAPDPNVAPAAPDAAEPVVAAEEDPLVWAVSASGEAQPSGETAAVDPDATSFIARPMDQSASVPGGNS